MWEITNSNSTKSITRTCEMKLSESFCSSYIFIDDERTCKTLSNEREEENEQSRVHKIHIERSESNE